MRHKRKIKFNRGKRSRDFDKRGNNEDRKRRKLYMLRTYGDGETVPCTHCGTPLDYYTVEADRIDPEGSYRRENVVQSCGPCNRNRFFGVDMADSEEQREWEAAMRDWAAKKRLERAPIKIRKNPRGRMKPAKRIRKSRVRIYFTRSRR